MRQKRIVMEVVTPEEREAATRKACIERFNPYRVYKQSHERGFKAKGYCIVYVDYLSRRKSVMKDIPDKRTADDLREIYEQAWAEGYITGSRE